MNSHIPFAPHEGVKLKSLRDVTRLGHKLCWITTSYLVATHILALLGFIAFITRPESLSLSLMVGYLIAHVLFAIFSTTAYAHRLVSHRATAKISNAIHIVFGYFGQTLAVQGSLVSWAGQHRVHHAVDGSQRHEEDPYSAIWFESTWLNFLWSHVLCYFFIHPYLDTKYKKRYQVVLKQHPIMAAQHDHYVFFLIALVFVMPFCVGWVASASVMGGLYMVWISVIASVITQNITWTVNSFTHMWGVDAAKSSAKNNFFWLLPMGEGNHHADHHDAPTDYRNGFGLIGWLSDPTRYLLLSLRALRLVGPLQRTSRAVEMKVIVERRIKRVQNQLESVRAEGWTEYEQTLSDLRGRLFELAKRFDTLKEQKRQLLKTRSEQARSHFDALISDVQYQLDHAHNELRYVYRQLQVELRAALRTLEPDAINT